MKMQCMYVYESGLPGMLGISPDLSRSSCPGLVAALFQDAAVLARSPRFPFCSTLFL